MEDFKKYFDSLPKFVQETLKQNGMDNKSEEEIRAAAENLMSKNG